MKTKKYKLNPITYFFVCLSTMIAFDLVLTDYILHNIFVSSDFKFLDIVYVQNTGAAFSSFPHSAIFLAVISILAVILIIMELIKNKDRYSILTCFFSAMLCSGIICNTYERLVLGYVRDFINLKFIKFPVFNISDVLINLGVLAIIVLIITKKYKNEDTNI